MNNPERELNFDKKDLEKSSMLTPGDHPLFNIVELMIEPRWQTINQ